MELKSCIGYSSLSVGDDAVSALYVQDEDTGEIVYLDRTQAEKLWPALKIFAETWEVPE